MFGDASIFDRDVVFATIFIEVGDELWIVRHCFRVVCPELSGEKIAIDDGATIFIADKEIESARVGNHAMDDGFCCFALNEREIFGAIDEARCSLIAIKL